MYLFRTSSFRLEGCKMSQQTSEPGASSWEPYEYSVYLDGLRLEWHEDYEE